MMRTLLLALLLTTVRTALAQSDVPTIILHDAVVFTAEPARPRAQAIAVRGERIVAVGTDAEILALAGPSTAVHDLDGRLVVPGLNDAHTHIGPWPDMRSLGLSGQRDPNWQTVLDSVRSAAAATPAGTWLAGGIGGAVLDDPAASRFALDAVAPDHPVWLVGFTGHGLLVNTAALRAMNVPDDAPDVPGGWYGRVEGTPTLNGWVWEYTHLDLNQRTSAALPRADAVAAYRSLSDRMLSWGVTSVQHMENHRPVDETLAALAEADVPLRWTIYAMPSRIGAAGETPLPVARPDGLDDRVRVVGTKWVFDATPVDRLAALRQPYADRPGWSGRINFLPDEIRAMLRAALDESAGQVALHVSGDSTLAVVLRTMAELAPAETWRARRLRIEHGDGSMPDLLPQMVDLGVVLVQNPLHLALPQFLHARYGPERTPHVQLLRSAVEASIPVALGADAGGSGRNPWLNLMLATLHPTNPAEALSREQALVAFTRGSAYAEGMEHEKGSLTPGMLADLAVLSQNVLEVPPDALPATESVLTMVGGAIVYRAAASEMRAAAQTVVDTFGERMAAAGADLGPAPTVEVQTTPFLIYYDPPGKRIVMPWWDDLSPAQRVPFALFAGGGDDEGEQLFRTFFHRFFVAHEAAHWFQNQTGTRKETLYANEEEANRIAVAFWRTEPDGEAFLSELERTLVGMVERIPDPTPPGEDAVTYFGAHYRELGRDPMKYGYYQFRFVLDAVRQRRQLDLDGLVAAALGR